MCVAVSVSLYVGADLFVCLSTSVLCLGYFSVYVSSCHLCASECIFEFLNDSVCLHGSEFFGFCLRVAL